MQSLIADEMVLAYHDRSDGGLIVTLAEMAFAGRSGLHCDISGLGDEPISVLFNEELGIVIQVNESDLNDIEARFAVAGVGQICHRLGQLQTDARLTVEQAGEVLLDESLVELQRCWAETTFRMQSLRDNPECANEEYALLQADEKPRLFSRLSYDPNDDISAPYQAASRPRIAVLREEGVNGQVEMAAAFDRAGFEANDVHMSDIIAGRVTLADFQGIAACGGFSYGDVLGAGEGWSKSILYNARARDEFAEFFARNDSFGLGICNGCQMMSNLYQLIPGASAWPRFVRNRSEQFEARVVMAEILQSPSLFLSDMSGSMMPTVVAHGEGQVEIRGGSAEDLLANNQACLRFVDPDGQPTEIYPLNPNGSALGLNGFCNEDGRFTIMMPHPERIFRSIQNSWRAPEWGEYGPWMRMFRNARCWID